VHTRSTSEAPAASSNAVNPVATDTWRKSHATATGTMRRRIFDTKLDQTSDADCEVSSAARMNDAMGNETLLAHAESVT
jgi:hypothetical protein